MAERFHPGYIDQQLSEREAREARHSRSFSQFTQFINIQGLDETEAPSLMQCLEQLFKYSSNYWEPARCEWIPPFADITQAIIKKINPMDHMSVTPQKFGYDLDFHYWLSIFDANHNLIVDPTGVPTDREYNLLNYSPYFGLIEFAPLRSKLEYERSESINPKRWNQRKYWKYSELR